MLYHEWEQALGKALRQKRRHYFTAYAIREMAGRTYRLAERIYLMDRFDGVFVGVDRHLKLAEWLIDNQNLAARYKTMINRRNKRKAQLIQRQIESLNRELERIAECKV